MQATETEPVTAEEQYALQALQHGAASAYQQKLALAVILKKLSRAYDLHFIPGAPDQTAFLSGRGFVGIQITKYLRHSPTDLKTEEKK